MAGRVTWLCRCCLLLSLHASRLGAQQPASPAESGAEAETSAANQRKQAAKRRFLRGLELARGGHWDAALAEFSASRELHPTRVALMNAALSLWNLRRHAEAVDLYTTLLAEHAGELRAEERARAEAALGQLSNHVGELSVHVQPRGARLVVDGRPRGELGALARLRVDVGTHAVRVSHPGYETYEATVTVASGQRRELFVRLVPLRRIGLLQIQEVRGRAFDVLVDGVVVGKTPWRGPVSVGAHSVLLVNDDGAGTAPSSVEVGENATASLVLKAEELDAWVRIEPVPSSALVHVDGVSVGAGVWQGRLRSGQHRVEVAATGHVPERRRVRLARGERLTLRVPLARDLSSPLWRVGFHPHLYAEAVGGLGWAATLGGSADAACAEAVTDPSGMVVSGCRERSRPLAVLFGVRAGYAMTPALGLELFLGYAALRETMVRRVYADRDQQPNALFASDYRDETHVSGPVLALSPSYRFFETTPLTIRAWLGVARFRTSTANRATFTGTIERDGSTHDFSEAVSVPEENGMAWAALIGPEIRVGYRLSRAFTVELGVLALLVMPESVARTGESAVLERVRGRRAAVLGEYGESGDGIVNPSLGVVTLREEDALGTFVSVLPSASVRVDF